MTRVLLALRLSANSACSVWSRRSIGALMGNMPFPFGLCERRYRLSYQVMSIRWLAVRSRQAVRALLDAYESKSLELDSSVIEYPLSHLPDLAKLGYRCCSFGSYVMPYYVDEENAAEIAHVFRQHRNYARLVLADGHRVSGE